MTKGTAPEGTSSDIPVREVRLGLVLNGGVSLAVWMGGVTQEIDAARQAAAGRGGTAELYHRLLDILRQTVRVDVIAGASAGGINGVVLAATIFSGKELPPLRDTWIELGDLQSLMRSPAGPDPPSLLKGDDVLLPAVQAVLDDLLDGAGEGPDQPLYLYVTATDLFGRVHHYSDSTGREFEELDSRRTFAFQFERSSGPPEAVGEDANGMRPVVDFRSADAADLLARAARATSSFPVAFEPHEMEIEELDEDGESITSRRWLIDGGVLDNQPFTPVLDRISVVPSDGPVKRVVGFVVPYVNEPGSFDTTTPEQTTARQSFAASSSLPRSLSKLQGLDRVVSDKADQATAQADLMRLAKSLGDDQGRADLKAAAGHLFPSYQETRRAGSAELFARWSSKSFKGGSGVLGQSTAVDPRSLPALKPEEAKRAEASLDDGGRPETWTWIPGSSDWSPEDKAWQWGLSPAERVAAFALLFLRPALDEDPGDGHLVSAQKLASDIVWQARSLKEQLRLTFREGDPGPDELLFRSAKAAFEMLGESALIELQQSFVALSTVIDDANQPHWRVPSVADLLHVEIVRSALSSAEPGVPFPFEFVFMSAGIESSLVHRAASPHTKLAGMKLGHFGGFLKRSWRANDWLWGRLDGVEHVLRAVFDVERLRALAPGSDDAAVTALSGRLAELAFAGEPEMVEVLDGAWAQRLDRANAARDVPRIEVVPGEEGRDSFARLLSLAIKGGGDAGVSERCLDLCRSALAARIQMAVLEEDLVKVADTAEDDAAAGSARIASGASWARELRRRQTDSSTGRLGPTDALELFRSLHVGEERVEDETSSRRGLDLGAQGAAVGAAMFAGDRSGLPRGIRAGLATVRGATLAASYVVRLLAREPWLGASAVVVLSVLTVWAITSPSTLLGALLPALAAMSVAGGAVLFAIATGTFEESQSTLPRWLAFAALLGVPLAFGLTMGLPGWDPARDWLTDALARAEDPAGDGDFLGTLTRLAGVVALGAAGCGLLLGVLELLRVASRPSSSSREQVPRWKRTSLNWYRALVVLALLLLAGGFTIERYRSEPATACAPANGCAGWDWDRVADEKKGTILVVALLSAFLVFALIVEILLPPLQRAADRRRAARLARAAEGRRANVRAHS